MALSLDVKQLRERIRLWNAELESPSIRGTLAVGMLAKGLLAFEGILTQTVVALVGLLDEPGRAHCKLLLGGKTISSSSLGDKCALLSGLKPDFERMLFARGVQVTDDFLGNKEMDVLHALVQYRNKLMHGKMGVSPSPEFAADLASKIESFCDSAPVSTAIKLSS